MDRSSEEFQKFVQYWEKMEKKDDKLERELDREGKLYHDVKESYFYIPFHGDYTFFDMISFIRNYKPRWHKRDIKVLDVGAGTGLKVKILNDYGVDAVGIEFQEEYVKVGRKAWKLTSEQLIVENAFNLTREFLSQFTHIYTYMPLRDPIRMGQLHVFLYSMVMHDTFFMEMLPSYYPMDLLGKNTKEKFGVSLPGIVHKTY